MGLVRNRPVDIFGKGSGKEPEFVKVLDFNCKRN